MKIRPLSRFRNDEQLHEWKVRTEWELAYPQPISWLLAEQCPCVLHKMSSNRSCFPTCILPILFSSPMGGFLSLAQQSFPPHPTWGVNDIPDLTGKVIIVTGASTCSTPDATRRPRGYLCVLNIEYDRRRECRYRERNCEGAPEP